MSTARNDLGRLRFDRHDELLIVCAVVVAAMFYVTQVLAVFGIRW